MYPDFERRAVRALVIGTILALLPGGAFYAFAFSYTPRQLTIVCLLAAVAVAAFLPLDVLLLRATLRPVRNAFAPNALERFGHRHVHIKQRKIFSRVFDN